MKAVIPTLIRTLYERQFGKPCVEYRPQRNRVKHIRFPYTTATALECEGFAYELEAALAKCGHTMIECRVTVTSAARQRCASASPYSSLVVKYQ